MKDFVVWLDSKSAHIFALKASGIEKSVVNKDNKDLHKRHKNDQHQDSHTKPFFKDVVNEIKDAERLLIMGPGLAKNHLQDYIKEHQPHTLAKNIVGLESLDSFEHETEKQMFAAVRNFFASYDLLERPI
jgi:stalled ribosome rescue protein Dom34